MWRRVHFLTLPRPEVKSPYHVWTKASSGLVVSPKAIRFSVNMTLMGVFTYKRNAWQTQGKWLYAHAIFHWSEMKTYQTALSGKYSFSEFSSTPWQKNICLLGRKETNGFHINLRGKKTQLNKFQCWERNFFSNLRSVNWRAICQQRNDNSSLRLILFTRKVCSHYDTWRRIIPYIKISLYG